MQLNLSTVIAALALATTAAADRLHVSTYCFFTTCNYNGRFVTDHGEYRIDAKDGCQTSTSVPAMTRICIDHGNERLHFQFRGQNRRCMRKTSSDWQHCSDDFRPATCSKSVWEEVRCDW